MLNILFGLLAVSLTIYAYYQTDRVRFLKANALAASFFGLTLLVNSGLSGAIISFVNVIVYVISIFASKSIRMKLTCIIPFFAFYISYSVYSYSDAELSLIHYLPAFASFFITLSALQSSIIINKILLFIGVLLWAVYSGLLGAWFALAADIAGIITIFASLYKLKSKKIYATH